MRNRLRCLSLLAIFASLLAGTAVEASELRETALVRAVKRAKFSVVNIHSEKTSADRDMAFDGPRKVNGMGTGVVIDERGYIVTNQHVINEVDSLRVTLYDGSTFAASVISYDRKHDLAVIKVDAGKPLPVMPLGTSSDLMLGETVIAVGNAFGYEHTVTQGIVSSLSRDVDADKNQSYKNLIQTDASINPGNSGGPLINLDGELVGINVAIRAGAQRIGFAIPIDDARKYLAKLLSIQQLNDTYHGLRTKDIKTADTRRLVIEATDTNSPAATAGFQAGDVITQVGKMAIVDGADLERALLSTPAGEAIDLTVKRDMSDVMVRLQLARTGNNATRNSVTVARANTPPEEDKTWKLLGLRLAPIQSRSEVPKDYRGGLKVVAVRPQSPASLANVRRGDILVGLHTYETIKPEDVKYVLTLPELPTLNPLKFWVVRNGNTLPGVMNNVAQ